jgi:hypothetical protein
MICEMNWLGLIDTFGPVVVGFLTWWAIRLQTIQGTHVQQAKMRLEFYDSMLETLRDVEKLRHDPLKISKPGKSLLDKVDRAKALSFAAFTDSIQREAALFHLQTVERLFEIIKSEAVGDFVYMVTLREIESRKLHLSEEIIQIFNDNVVFMRNLPAFCSK